MAKGPKKKSIRKPKARKSGTMGFAAVIGVIALLGIVGIVASRSGDSAGASAGPDIGDHFHAALGINICGQWAPNTPQYESAKGIHSHGDGFIHMHPYSRAGANENATVGLFLDQADEKVTNDSIELGGGASLKNGDDCKNLDNKPGKVRWTVNGEEKKGNPARYVPEDRDIIAIAFLPEGEDIGTPPIAGSSPSDLGGQPPAPAAPGQADPNQIPPASTTESTEAPVPTATTK
jgi:hypothetical protein